MLDRIRCAIVGHSVPTVVHPFWDDVFHATCSRCHNPCIGHYDKQFGTVYWEIDHSDPKPHPLGKLVEWLIDKSKS